MSALDQAQAGRRLRAPLFAALAAEVESIDVQTFLNDPGRRARIYGDLWRSLRPEILVVESGAGPPELVPDVLRRVSMVGNDLKLDEGVGTCGKEGQDVPVGVGQPTLRVDGLTRSWRSVALAPRRR